MKKLISALTALALTAGSATGVLANEGLGSGGSDSADVTGTYSKTATVTVYSVDIAWEGLNFTYNDEYEGVWNPETHEYEDGTSAGWTEGKGKITVTNHSNTGVTASMSYAPAKGYEEAGMNFSQTALEVETADNGAEGQPGQAVSKEVVVTPTGSLPANTENVVIGTITVSIN